MKTTVLNLISCLIFLAMADDPKTFASSLKEQRDLPTDPALEYTQIVKTLDKEKTSTLKKFQRKSKSHQEEKEKYQQQEINVRILQKEVSDLAGEIEKETSQKKLSKLQSRHIRLSANLEEAKNVCEVLRSGYKSAVRSLNQADMDKARIEDLHTRLSRFSDTQKSLYKIFVSREAIHSYWQEEFQEIVKAISGCHDASLALEVMELDSSYQDFRNLPRLNRVLKDQLRAWKLVKKSELSSDLPINEFDHFNNPNQVEVLSYILERRSLTKKDLLTLKHIHSQASVKFFKKCWEQDQEAPVSFWETIGKLSSTGYYFSKDSYVLDAAELLMDKKLISPLSWELASGIQNSYALSFLKFLSWKDLLSGKLFSYNNQSLVLTKMIRAIPLIRSEVQKQFLEYLIPLRLGSPKSPEGRLMKIFDKLSINESLLNRFTTDTNLQTLKFLGEGIRSRLAITLTLEPARVLEEMGPDFLFETNQYQLEAQKLYWQTTGQWPHLSKFAYITSVWQLSVFKDQLKGNTSLSESTIREIRSGSDLEYYLLTSGLFPKAKHGSLVKEFRSVPYHIGNQLRELIRDSSLKDRQAAMSLLPVFTGLRFPWQLELISEAFEKGWYTAIDYELTGLENSEQGEFLRQVMRKEHLKEPPAIWDLAISYLPYISDKDSRLLAIAMLRSGLDPHESFASIRYKSSLKEKFLSLGLREELNLLAANLASELLENEPEKINSEKTSDTALVDNKDLRTALIEHENGDEIFTAINKKHLKLCPDPDCPGLLDAKSQEDVCQLCQHSYCSGCGDRHHYGSCMEFQLSGRHVSSEHYPGLTNFRHGLSNVCFFNAGMKMLAHLAATHQELRDFFDPEIKPVKIRKDEESEHFQMRLRLQTAVHEWIRQIHYGTDEQQDGLANLTHQVIDRFLELMEASENYNFTQLKYNQFDAHEFVSPVLSFLDFENSPFAFTTLNHIDATELDYVSDKTETHSFFSVPAEGHKSMQKAVDAAWKTARLDGTEKVAIGETGLKSAADKTIYPVKAPEVLLIQLGRFVYKESSSGRFQSKKLTHEVKADQYLKVPVFRPGKLKSSYATATYELVAAVHHHGSLDYGHYTSYTFDPCLNQRQNCFMSLFSKKDAKKVTLHDDSRISPFPKISAGMDDVNKGAYLFAYRLRSLK